MHILGTAYSVIRSNRDPERAYEYAIEIDNTGFETGVRRQFPPVRSGIQAVQSIQENTGHDR